MKKILILTYFFPPGNFAGSYRIASWARYLHESGYYPIVVTRHWDNNQSGFSDISVQTDVVVHKESGYEVHCLPYKGNLRDKLIRNKGAGFLLRKFLSLSEIVLQNYFVQVSPLKNLYRYTRDYLRHHRDVELLITSGNPYVLFHFADLLNKEFKVKWVADYRDPWNTNALFGSRTNRVIRFLEAKSEKRWVKTAACFTTCSETWKEEISRFIHIEGHVVTNGYEEEMILPEEEKSDLFKILHIGTMYNMSRVEIVINAIIELIQQSEVKILTTFAGVNFEPGQANKIRKLIRGYEEFFVLTDRLEKKDLLKTISQSQLFLICGNPLVRGWHTTKIFDYLYYRKPILLCPSDGDVVENLIKTARAGYIANTVNETKSILKDLINEFKHTGKTTISSDEKVISQYSRRHQAGVLAAVLKSIPLQDHAEIVSCKRCVLTSLDNPAMRLDENGVCDICHTYDELVEREVLTGDSGLKKLNASLKEIKLRMSGKKYDCIIGVSGGVDSTYLVLKVKEWGLRPLLVHVDGGWNTEIAVSNIKNLAQKTGFDLYTHVFDWEQMRSLQKAFIRANVLDIDLPFDNAFIAVLYKLARKFGVKHILVGHNVVTEGYLPPRFTHYKPDTLNIRSIFRKFGAGSLKGFPLLGPIGLWWYEKILGIKFTSPLNWIEFNRDAVKETIIKDLNWREYGSKHCENIFTRFYQCYILYEKFGVDKRKSHLQCLICSGQISRGQALKTLEHGPYVNDEMLESDKEYFIKKLQLTREEFDTYIMMPEIPHTRYCSYINIYNFVRPGYRFLKSLFK